MGQWVGLEILLMPRASPNLKTVANCGLRFGSIYQDPENSQAANATQHARNNSCNNASAQEKYY